jgi:hypothetical protein
MSSFKTMFTFLLLVIAISAHNTHKVWKSTFHVGHGCKGKIIQGQGWAFAVQTCRQTGFAKPFCSDITDTKNINHPKYSQWQECGDIPHKHVCKGKKDPKCSGAAGLDPHFRKLNQKFFSYHGECDLVLINSRGFASGAGLDIHIRTEIRKSFSFIKALSMRVGKDTLEMEGKVNFHINSVFWEKPPTQFAGFDMVRIGNATWCRDRCSKAQIYRIFFDVDEYVELANMRGFLHVEINGPNFNNSTGLLGSRRDTGMVGRDGNLIADVSKYGQEWQVMGSDPQLFQMSRYPQHPDPCIQPDVSRRRISELTMKIAQQACSHLSGKLNDICIFDVSSTGDENLAYSPFYNY